MVKKTLFCLLVVTLGCSLVVAQNHRPLSIRVQPDRVVTPAVDSDATRANVTFFNNLGTPTALYYAGNGWVVSGPNNTIFPGTEQWPAEPFTPAQTGHITQIRAAVGFIGGTNQFMLGIYQDDGLGNPGTLLKQVNVNNAPTFGTCCAIVSKNINPPVAITAGTQYWIVASTSSTSDFAGAWAFTVLGMVNFNVNEGGWIGISDGGLALAVRGTVP